MHLRLSPGSLARAGALHPWRTIAAWLLLLVVAIALTITFLGDALTSDATGTLTNNPESMQADRLLSDRLGGADAALGEMIVVQSTSLTVDDPAYRQYVERLYGEVIGLGDEIVTGGSTYYLSGDESLVSADRHTTLLPLTIPERGLRRIVPIHEFWSRPQPRRASSRCLVTGQATLDAEIKEVAENDLANGESIGLLRGPDHSCDRLRRTGCRVPAYRSRHLRRTPWRSGRRPCSVSSWTCPSQS